MEEHKLDKRKEYQKVRHTSIGRKKTNDRDRMMKIERKCSQKNKYRNTEKQNEICRNTEIHKVTQKDAVQENKFECYIVRKVE